jgi:hypothetical protein
MKKTNVQYRPIPYNSAADRFFFKFGREGPPCFAPLPCSRPALRFDLRLAAGCSSKAERSTLGTIGRSLLLISCLYLSTEALPRQVPTSELIARGLTTVVPAEVTPSAANCTLYITPPFFFIQGFNRNSTCWGFRYPFGGTGRISGSVTGVRITLLQRGGWFFFLAYPVRSSVSRASRAAGAVAPVWQQYHPSALNLQSPPGSPRRNS